MIRSMSGYGRGSAQGAGVRVSFELRAVNHRFLQVSLRLPAGLSFFEGDARRRIGKTVRRGKVDATATAASPEGDEGGRVDRELAAAYARDLRAMADELGLVGEVDVGTLAALPGVVVTQELLEIDPERHLEVVETALAEALDGLDAMRRREGEHLEQDLRGRFTRMEELCRDIAEVADELPGRYRELLQARIGQLLDDLPAEIDDARLAQEVVHHVDRSDITEELVRLRSHLDKADALLAGDGAVGRSLEFLVQELHREVNTIGSKGRDVEIGEAVVELKSEIERVREQVQNVE